MEIYTIGIQGEKLKAFQNIVAIFKINSINFIYFFFLYLGLIGSVVVAYQFPVRLLWYFQQEFFKIWIWQ